jgi:hypothetical protein
MKLADAVNKARNFFRLRNREDRPQVVKKKLTVNQVLRQAHRLRRKHQGTFSPVQPLGTRAQVFRKLLEDE